MIVAFLKKRNLGGGFCAPDGFWFDGCQCKVTLPEFLLIFTCNMIKHFRCWPRGRGIFSRIQKCVSDSQIVAKIVQCDPGFSSREQ